MKTENMPPPPPPPFEPPGLGALAFAPEPLGREDLRDGLLVRSPNWLGDAVMALPAIACLRAMLPPACGLFVACPDGLAPFFESFDAVDAVVGLGDGHSLWSRRALRATVALRAGAALLLVNSPRSALSIRLAGVPRVYGARRGLRDLLLTRAYDLRAPAPVHQAFRYLAVAESLGAPRWDGRMPAARASLEAETAHPELLEIASADGVLAVAPGAAYGPAKMWPAASFREVCRLWLERGGVAAVVGAKGDAAAAAAVCEGLPAGRAFNLAGKTRLPDLMWLLSRARACVSNDSGAMHLAAAMGAPGAAVFGSTDPRATGPLGGRWTVFASGLPCAPCFRRSCPRAGADHTCLASVAPAAVWEALAPFAPSTRARPGP